MRTIGANTVLSDVGRVGRNRKHPLGGLVHQNDVAFGIGDDDRIGNRVDDQFQPVALVTHFGLGDPQRPIAVLDLFLGTREVGHVAEDRNHVGALAFVSGAGAEKLEQQVRSLERVDEQQFAPGQLGMGHGARRERGRKKHVVQAHRAAPALARVFRRGKQLFRVGVGDDQLAFGVGQQDRVGDGVDDAVEQHPLLPEPRLGQGRT